MKHTMRPDARPLLLGKELHKSGLPLNIGDPKGAYCPAPISAEAPYYFSETNNAREAAKVFETLTTRHQTTMDYAQKAGLNPFSEVAEKNDALAQVVSGLFFIAHDIIPSTAFGRDLTLAIYYNRIPVIFVDAGIRPSGGFVERCIYVEYGGTGPTLDDIESDVVELLSFLSTFTPGTGFDENNRSILTGSQSYKGNIVNLETAVKESFPHLMPQTHEGQQHPQNLLTNPRIFYELES